jgi:hypothetical protein
MLDANGNGELTEAELNAIIQGEGNGCLPSGKTAASKFLGDFLLLGLALLSLAAWQNHPPR